MSRSCSPPGLVLSDLHLFSRRSRGESLLREHAAELESAEVLVLNGDTFDFRWSQLPTQQATVEAALEWVAALTDRLGAAEIHYVLGNHDCLESFHRPLLALAAQRPRLHCHEYWLKIGRSLFLHGDCANSMTGTAGLELLRRRWRRDEQAGRLRGRLYDLVDATGASERFHRLYFPRQLTLERVSHYLDRALPAWRTHVDDCYFGHTHLPFDSQEFQGVRFHNTGSAITGMEFQPLRFDPGGEATGAWEAR